MAMAAHAAKSTPLAAVERVFWALWTRPRVADSHVGAARGACHGVSLAPRTPDLMASDEVWRSPGRWGSSLRRRGPSRTPAASEARGLRASASPSTVRVTGRFCSDVQHRELLGSLARLQRRMSRVIRPQIVGIDGSRVLALPVRPPLVSDSEGSIPPSPQTLPMHRHCSASDWCGARYRGPCSYVRAEPKLLDASGG